MPLPVWTDGRPVASAFCRGYSYVYDQRALLLAAIAVAAALRRGAQQSTNRKLPAGGGNPAHCNEHSHDPQAHVGGPGRVER